MYAAPAGDQVERETQTATTSATTAMATFEAAVSTNQQFYRPWQRNCYDQKTLEEKCERKENK